MATANPSRASRNGPSPTNRDVMIVGDSFFFRETYNGLTANVWDTGASPIGNRYLCYGTLNWLRYRTRLGFNFDGSKNFGVSGETNPQISSRFVAAMQQCDAATILRIVSVNKTSDAVYYSETMSSIAADVASAKAWGRYIVLLLPAAAGDSTFTSQRFTGAQRLARHQLRNDILNLYGFGNVPGVDVVDMDSNYADPASTTGDTLANMTVEGLHPSIIGARTRSLNLLSLFNKRFHPRVFCVGNNSDIYDATNNLAGALNPNPALDGTGGTVGTNGSGNIATSWTGGNGGDVGHTRAYSKVTGPNTGRPAQRCTLGGTFGATAQDVTIMFQNYTVVSGARYKLRAEFDGWSGVTGVSCLTLKAINTTGFGIWGADMDYSGTTGILQPTEVDGVMETPEFVTDGTTSRLQVVARGIPNAAMAGTIDILGIKLIRIS